MKILNIIIKHIRYILLSFLITILLYTCGRIFLFDQFTIPSDSMYPTLIPGDRIVVNKLVFGARIYKSYKFTEKDSFQSWRTYGIREIKPNDILVFNAPNGYNRPKIQFKINYVYSKRCIGTPGDTISIKNGFFLNNNFYGKLGFIPAQEKLSETPDSLIEKSILYTKPEISGWTIKDFGPLWIPKAGTQIKLDSLNYALYKKIIKYETKKDLSLKEGKFLLENSDISSYKFLFNYYFVCGDNLINSMDSRYWGFVPEEFIIGVATFISYSRDIYTEEYIKERTLKNIKEKSVKIN